MTSRRRSVEPRMGGGDSDAPDPSDDEEDGAMRTIFGALHRASVVPHVSPGVAAGIEHHPEVDSPPELGDVHLHCVDYSEDRLESSEPAPGQAPLAAVPPWARVRWLRVVGLHPYVINQLREELGFHTLTAEDIHHVPQRPRSEDFEDHVFVVTQVFVQRDDELLSLQVSMLLFDRLLVTFHEAEDELWAPLEARLAQLPSRLRRGGPGYLAYAMLDLAVDHGFPVLERYAMRLEQIEDAILEGQTSQTLQDIHGLKRDLAVFRRVLWPVREMVMDLSRDDHPGVDEATRAYLRDVHDHCVQLIDMVETFRDLVSGLTDLQLSMSSHRMNEVMKVLTIIATIFIPITFLAGVYGMNFRHLPELEWENGYGAFWLVCAATTAGLLFYFRRRGWFDG